MLIDAQLFPKHLLVLSYYLLIDFFFKWFKFHVSNILSPCCSTEDRYELYHNLKLFLFLRGKTPLAEPVEPLLKDF